MTQVVPRAEAEPPSGVVDRRVAPASVSPPGAAPVSRAQSRQGWMGVELSRRLCVVGWLVATGLFAVFATLTGGPGRVDAQESVYSTWAIAHGELNCAFPTVTMPHEPLIAPVYPLFSGAVAALSGIGHGVAFPSHTALGPHCAGADTAIRQWAARAGANGSTRTIGYLSWFALLAGIVAWLRSAGRGRTRWEPATLMVVAVLPPVCSCVGLYLHPQDLMALGFGLAAAACANRSRWAAAGALIALAVLSQQFALLVAAPLFVVAPTGRRVRFVGAAAATAMVMILPLFVMSGGTVMRAVTLGSGDNPSIGGTVMWELGHSGALVVLGSRLLPVVLALAVSWWAVRRLGAAASSPTVLMSLVATSLSLRLVLEQNIFEYYFMALIVTLILLDVTRGRIRGSVIVWLTAVLMTFSLNGYFFGTTSGLHLAVVIPPLVLALSAGLIVFGILRRRQWSGWNLMLWSLVVICALATWWRGPFFIVFPTWFAQGVLACTGAALAVTPLWEAVRGQGVTSAPSTRAPAPGLFSPT